ncbi:uncharacterized protein Triagg1_5132 [Trichoderma aggressivum f. europaeum]|uniref:C2H2-type domain-containing protein n=1 Tax=Trichoderma aggressivum f. europaeum TaxID=173218 RepID=A0AAE1LZS5_9HYPO|nr:hypothetical protein Triagg1_5132 [Trichoderma aggressivum f. europaeum]
MASQDWTNMPLEQDWTTMPAEEDSATMSWDMLNPDGSLPEVGVPYNFNEQPATTNEQPQWDLFQYDFLGPMVFDQQDQGAGINTALMPPLDTIFTSAPDITFVPAPGTTFIPAPDNTFIHAPDNTFTHAPDSTVIPTPSASSASNTPPDSSSSATTPPISNTISATNTSTSASNPGAHHCHECGKRFPKRSALNTHLRSSRAHPHEDVKCRCGKFFDKYGLKQHLIQRVNKCTTSLADFRCHCGFVVAAGEEEEMLDHAYACTRRRNRRAG